VKRRLAGELLRLPVRTHDIRIGRPVDVIVDPLQNRAVGFDVLCRDDEHRFLPWTAAVIDDKSIAVDSPIVMLGKEQLAFYRDRARSLRALVPVLEHVMVEPDGTLEVVSDDAA
jgi:hypothetical protein